MNYTHGTDKTLSTFRPPLFAEQTEPWAFPDFQHGSRPDHRSSQRKILKAKLKIPDCNF